MPSAFHLSTEEEREQYEKHENCADNSGYMQLLQPVIDLVSELDIAKRETGEDISVLDFGSGPNPVLADVLRERGFLVETYDAYFSQVLPAGQYSAVTSTEVVEHFCQPLVGWKQLLSFVASGGEAYVLTSWTDDVEDLPNWHYLREITHVSFYSKKTFAWIAERFSFSVRFERGVVRLRKMSGESGS